MGRVRRSQGGLSECAASGAVETGLNVLVHALRIIYA